MLIRQNQWLRLLNRRKYQNWDAMSEEEPARYQADTKAREQEDNKKLNFRFVY